MKNSAILKNVKKETLIVIGLYLLFFAWWYLTAYGFGDDPSEYGYILGFPEWFFYSCIVGYVWISVVVVSFDRIFFTEIDLKEGKEAGKDD